MPPAPGMVVMTKFCPSFSLKACATRRAVTSATPPGPNGRITRTGRSGYLAWARAAGAARPAAINGNENTAVRRDNPNSVCFIRQILFEYPVLGGDGVASFAACGAAGCCDITSVRARGLRFLLLKIPFA